MPQIIAETEIDSDIQTCFDLARDVGFYKQSLKNRNEIPVSGKILGLVEEGDVVTWETNHLGFMQHLTLKVTELKKTSLFVDEMTEGSFKSYRHDHIFKEQKGKTIMIDKLHFASKYGIIGKITDYLIFKRYLKGLMTTRNKILKQKAEELSKR
ncbi:MAG: SRPBCC family protein [Winogradskyella sp.]